MGNRKWFGCDCILIDISLLTKKSQKIMHDNLEVTLCKQHRHIFGENANKMWENENEGFNYSWNSFMDIQGGETYEYII